MSTNQKGDEAFIENVTFDEIKVGQSANLTRMLTKEDISLFAVVSGDVNPTHLDENFATDSHLPGIAGHAMWSGALISTLLGTALPGPGTIYLEQDLKFRHPVRVGDSVTATVTVKSKHEGKPVVDIACQCINQDGEIVAIGDAVVIAPTTKIRQLRPTLPEVEMYTQDRYQKILDRCHTFEPIRTAIVHPVKANALEAAADALREGLIIPVLIGPEAKIRKAAEDASVDLTGWEVIDAPHSHGAAKKAAELAATNKVDAIMKGSLHSDELLSALLPSAAGLRTAHRVSHAFVMDVHSYHKLIIITDAAINIAPGLEEKADICQNAINLWRSIYPEGGKPKVAVLSAVETVTSRMSSTLDAAAICKMADRGQITGGLIDGPLAFDNAISKAAAKEKDIVSDVAGDADILLVPNIEAGNVLAKQLSFLGHADAAGIVLGAKVPIMLTSRADTVRARLLSCALAAVLANARKQEQVV